MKGKLIVIEGSSDGVGKTTQYKRLYNKLTTDGYDVITHHFPTYNNVSASLVEAYLKGDLGDKSTLNPYAINSFYALDRYIIYKDKISKALEDGKIVLLDRYTTSSLIYQSSFLEGEEKVDYLNYVSDFEYNKLGLKEPDMVIFLKVSKEVASNNRKGRVDNEGIVNDIHEKDISFLDKVYDSGIFVSTLYNYDIINCDSNGVLRTIDDIGDEIYNLVKEKLL